MSFAEFTGVEQMRTCQGKNARGTEKAQCESVYVCCPYNRGSSSFQSAPRKFLSKSQYPIQPYFLIYEMASRWSSSLTDGFQRPQRVVSILTFLLIQEEIEQELTLTSSFSKTQK